MKASFFALWFVFALTCLAIASSPAAEQDSCASLSSQKLDKAKITSAVFLNDPQDFTLLDTPGMFGTPKGMITMAPFCRVVGFIEPAKNSHIGFEVWLPPVEKWNSRYFGVGNPAFEGALKYQGLKETLEKGYATASTDTGHQDPGHAWAMGQPERLIDWTHRAVHETTVVAKQLIKAIYGKPQNTRIGIAAIMGDVRDSPKRSSILTISTALSRAILPTTSPACRQARNI
jgi:feruloyl esterase